MRPYYLVRIDDVCPTTNWEVWDRVEEILNENEVTPLVGVVPDNQDPALRVGRPDPRFWDRVRQWQSRGWLIGMHGWQHRFENMNPGLLGVNRYSEFAGLPLAEQRKKLILGREKFLSEGIRSDLWIAPAHSFDRGTLEILRELQFRYVSDGFFLFPCKDEFGMLWVPQQLWAFRRRPLGVWTVCLHVNHWNNTDVQQFRNELNHYKTLISDFGHVTALFRDRRRSIYDEAGARIYRASSVHGSNIKSALKQGLKQAFSGRVGRAHA